MKPLWITGIILTAITGATITAISILQRTNQLSIALTEEWIASQFVKPMVAKCQLSFVVSMPRK
ncbi:hypothetical protein H6G96_12665 [Nostoc sp. FACHB-892]|uniref:hypothetical protein n=1 Tax=Nostoc sp. FACHB-892 TaxID=2692843 RepID=UPI00168776E2|nr:hypothetical protein [Nostoc sp. FACHB-892]MBD2727160.1 hypothetical protein [Nostoc sp. FACHB-892]